VPTTLSFSQPSLAINTTCPSSSHPFFDSVFFTH